jgi:hypothetical protein
MIMTESVRRMFHAKPSVHVVVVQLLVDLCLCHFHVRDHRLPMCEKSLHDAAKISQLLSRFKTRSLFQFARSLKGIADEEPLPVQLRNGEP